MILRPMFSAGLAAVPALLVSILLTGLFTTGVTCQEPPALLATSQYLFVVRGDWVYQYDVDTLLLKGRAPIPDPDASGPRAARLPSVQVPSVQAGSQQKPAPQPVLARPIERAKPADVSTLEIEADDNKGGAGGRFGSRGGGRGGKGGGKSYAAAIDAGLTWLANHQDEAGYWDADGFMKHDSAAAGPISTGPGNAVHDVGVTGLAMLAMLGDGSNLRSGPYKEHLKRAAKWLRDQQHSNGLFGTNASHDFIYDHAIATYAMCEVYGLSDYKLLKDSAQKGINYLESHRNTYSVWRYQPRDNDNDISVTSWCLIACESAAFFGLDVNPNAIKLAEVYLDQVSTPDGRHGYTKAGERSSRKPGEHAIRYPIEKGEALTAAGLFCRFFIGQDTKDKPIMKAAADLLLQNLPRWDTKAGTIDYYYWYYGTYAMFQMGGRYWKTWSKHIGDALLPNQIQAGNAAGSWDPVGVWSEDGGRVYSTAMSVLTLEAYYRYSRLIR